MCGLPTGSRYHAMKAPMPAWATRPTHERSSADRARYQSWLVSIRRMAAVDSTPALRSTRRRVAALVRGPGVGMGSAYLYAVDNGCPGTPQGGSEKSSLPPCGDVPRPARGSARGDVGLGLAAGVAGGAGGDVEQPVALGRLARPADGSTSPRLASICSARTATEGPSMWKKRRAAGRVSEKPKPSAPSEAKSPGTHWPIWSCTWRM